MRDFFIFLAITGFASGIAIASRNQVPWPITAFAVLLALIIFLISRHHAQTGVAIVLVALALGMARASLEPTGPPGEFAALFEQKVELQGTVAADPDIRETTQRVPVDVELEGSRMKLLAVLPLHPELSYGQPIEVRGMLERPEPFATDAGREFRYDRFLAKDGIFAIVLFAQVESLDEPSPHAQLRGSLYRAKHAFMRGLERALPEPYAALAGGILAGGKQGLGEELLDAFTVAGLVHIVVLSGYNVMIVAEGILKGLRFLSRRSAAAVAALAIGCFVLAAGAGPASIRAGLMAGVALYARASGRTYDALRALLLVFALMLLRNPRLLLDDPGFQLSFVATLGLILGAPLIEARLAWIRPALLRDLLATTSAAQVAVLPLLLYSTGMLPLIALPANVLALPVMPLAMLLSALAGVIGMASPGIAPALALPALALLWYVAEVARIAAALPLAQVALPAFPFWVVPALYALLAIGMLHMRNAPASSGRVRASDATG